MMHYGDVMVVPSNRDGIPIRFSDRAAVSGIASPANEASLFEVSGFGGSHDFGFPLS